MNYTTRKQILELKSITQLRELALNLQRMLEDVVAEKRIAEARLRDVAAERHLLPLGARVLDRFSRSYGGFVMARKVGLYGDVQYLIGIGGYNGCWGERWLPACRVKWDKETDGDTPDARLLDEGLHGEEVTHLGAAWHGVARRGKAGLGAARHGTARQGKG